MNWYEAIILGIVQGLTEFLPVSSSGHLELGKFLFGIDAESNFYYTLAVHGATVLSTIAVFRKDIMDLFRGFFKFRMNEETTYVLKIFVSMIPVGVAGFFMKDIVENFFTGNMTVLGIQFLITALLLVLPYFIKSRERSISYSDAFIMGLAQAFAILPAVSRSGATIATGLMLGNRKEEIAKFSFLMVLIPIVGANFVEIFSNDIVSDKTGSGVIALGFIAAFISGYYACKWMITLVKNSRMIWFAIYCAIVGLISILLW
jgi:undecaprenyl-diphosphatase